MSDSLNAAGVELDFSRLELPADLGERYREAIDRATQEMKAVEAGENVNSDEGRQVGHYWLRNPKLAPGDLGTSITQTWQSIDDFARDVFVGRFTNILWIGIGGSGLGPQLLYDSLRVPGVTPNMFFFDNTDPFGFRRTVGDIEQTGGLKSTLTVVVSKSGGTKETANGMKFAKAEYERAGLSFEAHAAAVTQPDSALDKLAGPETADDPKTAGPEWLKRFAIWDWVGGRTSLFSAVGLLPARLLGFDSSAFLAGAREMDDVTRAADLESNPALKLATAWFHVVEHQSLHNMVVLPYCDRISLMSKYLQQLVMESVGKEGKGISVFGNKGSTDQHSYVQQLRDGYNDFFAMFLRVLDPEVDEMEVEPGVTAGDYLMAFQEGTARALTETGRLSMRITVDRFNEHTLGALIGLFERAVGYYGAMLGINSYHQPGVEAGKAAAGELLVAQLAVLKHLPGDAVELAQDDERRKEFAKQLRAEEELKTLTDDFVSDLLKRFAVCGRLTE
ncbi:MAG: glucose-6-phosphate isomerase [Rhodopirellula sp.]|nr:glucose-6-phosphate isomerase [Rhodopirellula sp.]